MPSKIQSSPATKIQSGILLHYSAERSASFLDPNSLDQGPAIRTLRFLIRQGVAVQACYLIDDIGDTKETGPLSKYVDWLAESLDLNRDCLRTAIDSAIVFQLRVNLCRTRKGRKRADSESTQEDVVIH